MSLDPETRNRAYQFFVAEAPELLQAIEGGLLTLSEDYSTAKVHNIMRSAHSIKGGAAGVGLDGISAIAHRLEDIFKSLYHAQDKITPEFERKLLEGYDCLQRPLTEQIATGPYDAEKAIMEADTILADLEGELAAAMAQGSNFIPSSEDLGVDVASSILEVDVEEGLNHLKKVISNPDHYEVMGEVRSQAEVCLGLAEIIGVTGFGEIARSAIAALDNQPQAVIEITELMVRDLEAGQKRYLSGEDKSGGHPSPELLAYTQPETTLNIDEIFGRGEETESISVDTNDTFAEEETVDTEEVFGEEIDLETTLNIDEIFGGGEETDPETSLDQALAVINQNFEELRVAEDLPTPPIPSVKPVEPPVTPPEKKAPTPSSNSRLLSRESNRNWT